MNLLFFSCLNFVSRSLRSLVFGVMGASGDIGNQVCKHLKDFGASVSRSRIISSSFYVYILFVLVLLIFLHSFHTYTLFWTTFLLVVVLKSSVFVSLLSGFIWYFMFVFLYFQCKRSCSLNHRWTILSQFPIS